MKCFMVWPQNPYFNIPILGFAVNTIINRYITSNFFPLFERDYRSGHEEDFTPSLNHPIKDLMHLRFKCFLFMLVYTWSLVCAWLCSRLFYREQIYQRIKSLSSIFWCSTDKAYGVPGTLLVEPFYDMLLAMKEEKLPRAHIIPRYTLDDRDHCLRFSQIEVGSDWHCLRCK